MDSAELRSRLTLHPRVTDEVLGRLLAVRGGSISHGGTRSSDVGYTLVPGSDGTFQVDVGDGRGSSSPASDGGHPIVFPDEDAACRWVLDRVERALEQPRRDPAQVDPGDRGPALAARAAANRREQERRVRERIARLREDGPGHADRG